MELYNEAMPAKGQRSLSMGSTAQYQKAGIEFKNFSSRGFRQSTFLCTTLKCIEKFRIPFIKSGIPASNLGSSEARNPAKFAAWKVMHYCLQMCRDICFRKQRFWFM